MPRTIYEDPSGCANTYGVLLPLCLLMLMDGMRLWSCPSCPLLTPLSRAGRIDFPWKLSDAKRLLALWCQHSVILLSVFLYIISGTHHSPFFLVFSPPLLLFSLPHFTFSFSPHLSSPPVFPAPLLLLSHVHHGVIYILPVSVIIKYLILNSF